MFFSSRTTSRSCTMCGCLSCVGGGPVSPRAAAGAGGAARRRGIIFTHLAKERNLHPQRLVQLVIFELLALEDFHSNLWRTARSPKEASRARGAAPWHSSSCVLLYTRSLGRRCPAPPAFCTAGRYRSPTHPRALTPAAPRRGPPWAPQGGHTRGVVHTLRLRVVQSVRAAALFVARGVP